MSIESERADLIRDLREAVETLRAESTRLRGALAATDERILRAGQAVGLVFGSDTPEHLADEILTLRARLAELEPLARACAEAVEKREEHRLAREVVVKLANAISDGAGRDESIRRFDAALDKARKAGEDSDNAHASALPAAARIRKLLAPQEGDSA